jgi:hypothetical protein
MFKKLAIGLGTCGLGAVLGLTSAWLAVERIAIAGDIRLSGWRGNANTGAATADPYTRAAVAKVALLALARSETIYFFRSADDAGDPLDPACRYDIAGADQPARWWSITAYDEQFYLPRNTDAAPSVHADGVVKEANGAWRAVLGPKPDSAANWISSNGAKALHLTIRLYNPDPAVQADPSRLALPSVVKVACP